MSSVSSCNSFLSSKAAVDSFIASSTFLRDSETSPDCSPSFFSSSTRVRADNAIFLSDDAERARKKIFSMITDPQKIRKNDPGHPEICNVFSHHNVFTAAEVPQIEADCKSGALGCVDCKKKLTENMSAWLAPLRERRKNYEAQKGDIKLILEKGKEKASRRAKETLNDVKKVMGLMLHGGG